MHLEFQHNCSRTMVLPLEVANLLSQGKFVVDNACRPSMSATESASWLPPLCPYEPPRWSGASRRLPHTKTSGIPAPTCRWASVPGCSQATAYMVSARIPTANVCLSPAMPVKMPVRCRVVADLSPRHPRRGLSSPGLAKMLDEALIISEKVCPAGKCTVQSCTFCNRKR
jgi:hypothetical protein